jgi:hypothetical protein
MTVMTVASYDRTVLYHTLPLTHKSRKLLPGYIDRGWEGVYDGGKLREGVTMRYWDGFDWFVAIFATVVIFGAIAGIALAINGNREWNTCNRDCAMEGYAGYSTYSTVPSCWKPLDDGSTLMVPYEKVMGEE